ncbi:uncharacterized protein PG986_015149 [Apiospora aurea]|uniref:Uncharacterized protein n=1 Tax=Apiospora aurea TaxID=335848 RepID=A0ABR1PRR4_9PEZI
MDRSVSFGITTVLLPGESASIVEEVMSIFVGNQFVSEQVLRTIGTLPPGENFFPSPVDGVTATTAETATGTGALRTGLATVSIAEITSAISEETMTTTAPTSTGAATADTSSSMTTSSAQLYFSTTPTSTPATTDASKATTSAVHESSGPDAGAIAGIAIGCVVAGVLLGFVAAWLLPRRKRRRWQPPQSASYYPVKDDTQEKLFQLYAKPDRELVAELRSLDRTVGRHVEEHCHAQPVQDDTSTNPEDLAQVLVKLGIDNSINEDDGTQQQSLSASRLSSLALDPSTRFQTLRHIIMRVAFGSTALRSGSSISMLPPFVAAFGRCLEESESEPEPGLQRGTSDDFSTALTKWRQLSVFLLRHANRTPTDQDRAPQAQQLAVELNRFLAPFVAVAEDRDDDESDTLARYEQENDLREALVECATLGYVLFSQPAEYSLVYSDGKKRVAMGEGGGSGNRGEDGGLSGTAESSGRGGAEVCFAADTYVPCGGGGCQ